MSNVLHSRYCFTSFLYDSSSKIFIHSLSLLSNLNQVSIATLVLFLWPSCFTCLALACSCCWKSATMLGTTMWRVPLRMASGQQPRSKWDTQSNNPQHLDLPTIIWGELTSGLVPIWPWYQTAVLPCEKHSQRTQWSHICFTDPQRIWDNKHITFVHFVDVLTVFLYFLQRILPMISWF